MNPNSLRRTGRTTRLLMDAIRHADKGGTVIVMAANEHHAEQMRAELGAPGRWWGIEVKAVTNGDFNWSLMRSIGDHNVTTLVDHHAIETQFAHVLEELHRYDSPTEGCENRRFDA